MIRLNIYSVAKNVLFKMLTSEDYCKQFLLNLSIILFGRCQWSGSIRYGLSILH